MRRLLFLVLLALPAFADDAQPLSNNSAVVGVGYGGKVLPFVQYERQVTPGVYDATKVQVTGISHGVIQTVVTNGPCYYHTLGEYLVVGGCGGLGPAMTGKAMGMAELGNTSIEYRFGKSQHWGARGEFQFIHAAVGGQAFSGTLGAVLHWK